MAVAHLNCHERGCLPREIGSGEPLRELQRRLDRTGQFLPGIEIDDPRDLAPVATVTASSRQKLGTLPGNHAWLPLESGWAMLLPLSKGPCPVFAFEISSDQQGSLRVELRRVSKPGNFTRPRLDQPRHPGV